MEILDVLFIIAFSVAFLFDISKNIKLKSISFPLFIGYLFRIFLLFWDIYARNIFILPNSGLDSEGFYKRSLIVMDSGFIKGKAFPNLMGSIFSLIGSSRLYGQFIVVLFSIISLILFALILYDIDISIKTKKIVFTIVCLLPNLAILSSIFLRESFISMCINISFYCIYKWMKKGNLFNYIIALVLIFIAAMFHSGTIAVALGYIAILLLYDKNKEKFRFNIKNILPTIILIFTMSYLFSNYQDLFFGRFKNVESISDMSEDTVRGDTSYLQYVGNSNNILNMVIYTIPRIFFFIASPLPFQWRGLSDIIAFCFSSVYYITILYFTIKYFKSGDKRNRKLIIALSIIIICTFFVFGWGVANAGTACRHRDKIAIICGVLFALVIDNKFNNIKDIKI